MNVEVVENVKRNFTITAPSNPQGNSIDLPVPIVGSEWKPFVGFFILFNILLLQGAVSYGYIPSTTGFVTEISHVLSFVLGLGAIVAFEQRSFLESLTSVTLKKINGKLLLYFGLLLQAVLGVVDFAAGSLETWSILESFACIVGLYLLVSWTYTAFLRDIYLGCTFIPDLQPNKITIMKESGSEKVDAQQVKVGDTIQVSAGDRIFFDGEVISGCAEVRERKFTGQAKLLVKDPKTRLYAGSEVQIGSLLYTVTSLLDEGFIYSFAGIVRKQLSQIAAGVQDQNTEKGTIAFGVLFLSAILIGLGFSENGNMRSSLETVSGVLIASYLLDFFTIPFYLHRRLLLASYSKGVLYRDFQEFFSTVKMIKNFLIALFGQRESDIIEIESYDVLDSRIDQTALASILVSLCSRSGYQLHDAVANYLRKKYEDLTLYNPSSYMTVEISKPIAALVATIENIEFTLGNEDFLLQRGVQLDIGDIGNPFDKQHLYYYVSLGREVVARLLLHVRAVSEGRSEVSALQEDNVRVCLCTDVNSNEAQIIGQQIGLSGTDVFANANQSVIEDISTRLKDIMVSSNDNTPQPLIKISRLTSSHFNEYQWDLAASDITTFEKQLPSSMWSLHVSRLTDKICSELKLIFYILLGVVVFGGALSIISPLLILTIMLLGSLYTWAKCWHFRELTRP